MGEKQRTPVRTSDDFVVANAGGCAARHAKVRKLDASVLVCQDISTFDVSVNHTLVVEVYQAFENLRDVDCDQRFRELSKSFTDVV